jgi:hypothetical protein
MNWSHIARHVAIAIGLTFPVATARHLRLLLIGGAKFALSSGRLV